MTALIAALLVAVSAAAQAPQDLPQAQRQAREAVAAADPGGAASLRRDLEKMADALDAANEGRGPEREEEDKSLSEISREGRRAVKALRGRVDPRLAPSLDALDKLYKDLPSRAYARPWGGDLQRIVAEQLRWSGERAQSPEQLNAELSRLLVLPKTLPADAEVEDLAVWPVEIPLAQFKKLDPIRVFMLKHRVKRPARYAATTPGAIVDGRHNVEAGVIVEGTVTAADGKVFDQDYCFNVGDLHVELTPEWRRLHRKTPRPKAGDKVRLKGWTYYDYFHKAEHEFDPRDPVMGDSRFTLWEIHPVQDVEILP